VHPTQEASITARRWGVAAAAASLAVTALFWHAEVLAAQVWANRAPDDAGSLPPAFVPSYQVWSVLAWASLAFPLLWLTASVWQSRAWTSSLADFTAWALGSATVVALLHCLTVPYGWLHAAALVAALAAAIRAASLLRRLHEGAVAEGGQLAGLVRPRS
jgi:hypothetical protein